MKIAHIAPTKNSISETFVRYHSECFPSSSVFYYGDFLPTSNEIDGRFWGEGLSYYLHKIKLNLKLSQTSSREQAVIESFRKHKIGLVYAEFGQTGAEVCDLCDRLALPLVVNFHGADISSYEILEKYTAKYQRLFEVARVVVGVSKKMCRTLQEMGCPKDKIYYLPCHPDPSFFDLHADIKSNQILAVGRFVDKKAPYYTLLAFQQAVKIKPELTLNFIGDGPLLNTCKNLTRALKIPNVTFHGALSHEKTKSLFSKSAIFVQHSIIPDSGDSEGTPVSILEAAAMGMAVVSTKHAGIPDVIEDGKMGYLVEEHDVDGMAKYIIDLSLSEEKRVNIAEYSRQKVAQSYSNERYKTFLKEIIEKSLSS